VTQFSTPEIINYICTSVFAAALFVYIFYPGDETEGEEKTRLVYLYERKDVIYENLRDLNFEFKSGKFTQADYDGMRTGMEAEAARILAEIEGLEAANA